MSRPRKDKEPLVVVPIRLPADFVARIDAEAALKNVSRSDVLRLKIDSSAEIKTTGKPSPAKRERLLKASKADPKLLMQLASIGNNINQLARSVNTGLLIGQPENNLNLLIMLEAIEAHLRRLSAESGGEHAD